MELQTTTGGLVQVAEVEVSATRDPNGQIVQLQRTVNRQRPADAVPVIRDPENERLTVAETVARMQAVEAQITDLRGQNERLQLDRANALKTGSSTAEISVKQFAVQQDIDTLTKMLEGLKLDIHGARQRETVAQFEQTTADLLNMQSAEQKAYDALQKAQRNFQTVVSGIQGLRQTYDALASDLKTNYRLPPTEINERGQLEAVNALSVQVSTHNPKKAGYPGQGAPMAATHLIEYGAPEVWVDPRDLPDGWTYPSVSIRKPETQEGE